jgi:protein TonB
MFEAFVTERGGGQQRRRGPRRLVFVISVALHAALLTGAVAHSFWQVDELSPVGVTITFIQAMAAPPPPPPPPPAAAVAEKARPKAKKPRLEVPEIVQPAPPPVEQPPEEKPAEVAEAGEQEESAPEGQPGGVEGGVAGGVLGRIDPTPPPPPPPTAPITIAPSVGASYRLTDLDDPRYRPSLPSAINRPGMSVWGVFRICVAANGNVSDVTIIKSADALVDNDWIAKMKTWRYRPYSVDGRPVPFCHPARIVVNVRSG